MVYRSPFSDFTGQQVRVAILDSGVNPAHPHVSEVAGGVNLSADIESRNFLDFIGHGTAVAGAIREKAPGAMLYAVKVFDQTLRTNAEIIVRGIEWAIEHEMHIINLSLGTLNKAHCERFNQIIERASACKIAVVAAREMSGEEVLPGCLPGVIAVGLDSNCPRDFYRNERFGDRLVFMTSGYPRSIPGVSPERNLNGISFAVANMAGFVARARQAYPAVSVAELEQLLFEAAVC